MYFAREALTRAVDAAAKAADKDPDAMELTDTAQELLQKRFFSFLLMLTFVKLIFFKFLNFFSVNAVPMAREKIAFTCFWDDARMEDC